MIATLAQKHTSWQRRERELYGGQTVEVSEDRDRSGRRLCLMLSGPLAGVQRWFADDEIAEINEDSEPERIAS